MVDKKNIKDEKKEVSENNWAGFAYSCLYNFILTIIYGVIGSNFMFYILLKTTDKKKKKEDKEMNKYFKVNNEDYNCLISKNNEREFENPCKEYYEKNKINPPEPYSWYEEYSNDEIQESWLSSLFGSEGSEGDYYDNSDDVEEEEQREIVNEESVDLVDNKDNKEQSGGNKYDDDDDDEEENVSNADEDESSDDEDCDNNNDKDSYIQMKAVKKRNINELFFISRWILYIKNWWIESIAKTYQTERSLIHKLHGVFSSKDNCGFFKSNKTFQMFIGPIIYFIMILSSFIYGASSHIGYLVYTALSTNGWLLIAFVMLIVLLLFVSIIIGMHQFVDLLYKFTIAPLFSKEGNKHILKSLVLNKDFLSIMFMVLTISSASTHLKDEISMSMAGFYVLFLFYNYYWKPNFSETS